MSMLIGKTAKVGYFRPIIEDFEDGKVDNHIKQWLTILVWYCFEDAFAITKVNWLRRKIKGKIEGSTRSDYEKFKKLEEQFEFRFRGTSFSGEGTVVSWIWMFWLQGDTNNHCRFWGWKNIEELIDSLYLAYDSFKVKDGRWSISCDRQ
jgi:phosphate acetyltransferase